MVAVEIYHAAVRAQLAVIPGNTLNAKARKVLAEIRTRGATCLSACSAGSWTASSGMAERSEAGPALK